MKTSLAILTSLLFLTYTLSAQDASRLNDSDQDFLQKAALSGLAEVKYGELAQRLGSSQAYKTYGKTLVEHHQKANDELKKLVEGKNYPALPTDISGQHQTNYARISRLSGIEFDQAFREQMIKDHEEAIRLFRSQAEQGTTTELREWARKTLPTLERHLAEAQQLGSQNDN